MDPRIWIHTKMSWIRNTIVVSKPVPDIFYNSSVFGVLEISTGTCLPSHPKCVNIQTQTHKCLPTQRKNARGRDRPQTVTQCLKFLGSFYQQAKKGKPDLIVFDLITCYFLKTYLNLHTECAIPVPNKQRNLEKNWKKLIFCWHLKSNWRKRAGSGSGSGSGAVIQWYGSADPDTYQKNVTDPEHWLYR